MSEKFPLETAKKPDELDATYKKVKTEIAKYGFSKISEMKSDVVKKAMTEGKKPANFEVEVEVDAKKKIMMVQLYCDVPGKMKTVLGRSEIGSAEDYEKAVGLAKNANLKRIFA